LLPHFGQYDMCSPFSILVLMNKYLKYAPHRCRKGKVICALTVNSRIGGGETN
jgi:hypothetical protein